MLLERFLKIIRNLFPEKYLKISTKDLAQLNPDRITVENVRSVLNITYRRAIDICETAVNEGYFKKQVAVFRPDGSIACIVNSEIEIPPKIYYQEEVDGHYEEEELETRNLEKRKIYSLAA